MWKIVLLAGVMIAAALPARAQPAERAAGGQSQSQHGECQRFDGIVVFPNADRPAETCRRLGGLWIWHDHAVATPIVCGLLAYDGRVARCGEGRP